MRIFSTLFGRPPFEPPPAPVSPPAPEGAWGRRLFRFFLYLFFGTLAGRALFSIYGAMFGDRAAVAPPTAEAAVTAIGMTSTPFWVLFIIGALILAVWAVIYRRPPQVWAFAVLLGITTFHWLFWAIGPNVWSAWFHSQVFWPMNAATILAVFFASQGGAAARYAGFALGALLVVTMGISVWEYFVTTREKVAATTSVTPSGTPSRLSADVVLPIIAECESGGQQFEADGVTPKQNATSTAIGKYQIMASLHEEKAKGMGIDIRTLEGNEAYAKFLYETSGTLHWEADTESKACWEPKLLALGYKVAPSTPFTDFNLIVRSGEPGKLIIPVMWRWDWAGPIPKGWTTDAYLDAGGNRVQIFEVVPPATEVTLPVRMIQCATRQECAW